jgi:ATP-dependent DNA ligase
LIGGHEHEQAAVRARESKVSRLSGTVSRRLSRSFVPRLSEKTTSWPLPLATAPMRYDHASADRFRHGIQLIRVRPDKAPRQCTFEQLQAPARPGRLVGRILHRDEQRVR